MTDINRYELQTKKISDRIKEERKAKGLTQGKLAEEIAKVLHLERVGQTTIAEWETGKTVPPLDRLVALASIFDCDVSYLLGDCDERRVATANICELTGLSESAVGMILDFKQCRNNQKNRTVGRMSWLFCKLLEKVDFFHLIREMSRYIDTYTLVREHFTDDSPGGEFHDLDGLHFFDADILCLREKNVRTYLNALLKAVAEDAENCQENPDVFWKRSKNRE